jgi:hypothetical protein
MRIYASLCVLALVVGCGVAPTELPPVALPPAAPIAVLDAAKPDAGVETKAKKDEGPPLQIVLKKAWANDLRPDLGVRVHCTAEIVNRTGEIVVLKRIDVVVSSPDGAELSRQSFIHPESCVGFPLEFKAGDGSSPAAPFGYPDLEFPLPGLPDGVTDVRVQLVSKIGEDDGPASEPQVVHVQQGVWPSMKLRGRDGKTIEEPGAQDRAEAARRLAVHLAHEDAGIRYGAALWLGMIGPWAEEALPALAARLEDSDPDVRQMAQMAIAKIKRKVPPEGR